MSGLDEVEEWLRERSVLLQTFEEYGKQLISYYMKNSERNVRMLSHDYLLVNG